MERDKAAARAVLVLAVLVLGQAPLASTADAGDAYAPHAPIRIFGDAELRDTAVAEGWPGSGYPDDPFVISGLLIDTSSGTAITVANTRAHLVIEDSLLQRSSGGRDLGLLLDNVQNVVVRNVSATGHVIGIYVSDSRDVVLEHNTATGNQAGIGLKDATRIRIAHNDASDNLVSSAGWRVGINVFHSTHITVTENRANGNDVGIRVTDDSDENTVQRNQAEDNRRYGIWIYQSDGNEVSGNQVARSGEHGLNIGNSRNSLVHRNTLVDNGYRWATAPGNGIFVHPYGEDNRFISNTAEGNAASGFGIQGGWWPSVVNNTFRYNECGIQVHSTPLAVLRGNLLEGNGCGMRIIESRPEATRNRIVGNDVGLVVQCGRGTYYDNVFENDRNAILAGSPLATFQVLRREGPNIAGGPHIGGNLWHDYAGADRTGDGFGDTPHPVETRERLCYGNPTGGGAVTDLFPLVAPTTVE